MSEKIKDSLKKMSPRPDSQQNIEETTDDKNFFKKALWLLLGFLFLFFLTFCITFFISLRGEERTLVPNVEGETLTNGLIALQEKELYPRIQVRFTENPLEKNHIISQNPEAGSITKAGRRVKLVVSKGAVIDKVGDYLGKDLQDVRSELQTLFASYTPLLLIQDPIVYVFDDAPAGTIIEQKPLPETPISGVTDLKFIVSRGPTGRKYLLDNFKGLKWQDALNRVVRSKEPFIFSLLPEDQIKKDMPQGVIIDQYPEEQTLVSSQTPLKFTLTPPVEAEKGYSFGIFTYDLPRYPVAVDISAEVVSPNGKVKILFKTQTKGRTLAFPYEEKEGSIIRLKVYDEVLSELQL